MKKYVFIKGILLVSLAIFMFSSCEKPTKGFAPESIKGKTFNGNIYFKNSSSFSFVNDIEDENTRIIGTPSYTYRKTGDYTADLSYSYTLEHFNNVTEILNYTETVSITYHLHFTSTEAGWGTGSKSITGLPSYLSYDPTIEYVDFTLY